jgi:hypothetical protein
LGAVIHSLEPRSVVTHKNSDWLVTHAREPCVEEAFAAFYSTPSASIQHVDPSSPGGAFIYVNEPRRKDLTHERTKV